MTSRSRSTIVGNSVMTPTGLIRRSRLEPILAVDARPEASTSPARSGLTSAGQHEPVGAGPAAG